MLGEAGTPAQEIGQLVAREAHMARTVAIQKLEDTGAHRITPRTFRSFMATRVRNQREIVVADLDRQAEIWMGHHDQRTTALYEIMDPDYLRECAAATDLVIDKIGELTRRRSMWPIGSQPELPLLRVVKG